jgi:hypothetical protein
MRKFMISTSLLALALFIWEFEHHAANLDGPPPETHFVHSVSGPAANTSVTFVADTTIPVEYEVRWPVEYAVGLSLIVGPKPSANG